MIKNMSNSTILMKLGIGDYTAALKTWVTKQIKDSSTKIGGLKYNSETHMLHVIKESKNGQEEETIGKGIDMAQFIALGILSDVRPGEKNGQFTFIFKTTDPETGEETTKNYEVDFGELVNSYPVDDVSIEINDNGEIAVKDVDAKKTTLKENIRVLGGPLSGLTSNWPWQDKGVNVIPKDMSLAEILSGLFYNVIPGTVGEPSVTWNPSFKSNPTITSSASSTIVEVGTKVKFTVTPDYTLNNNTRTLKFTCTPGYYLSTGVDEKGNLVFGSFNKNNYSTSETGSSKDSTCSISWRGKDITTTHNNNIEYTIEEDSDNILSVTQAVTATAPLFSDITVYGANNLHEVVPGVNKSFAEEDSDKTTGYVTKTVSLPNSITHTITGVRAYWMGSLYKNQVLDTTNGVTENAITNSELTKNLGIPSNVLNVKSNTEQIVIATTKRIKMITSRRQSGAPQTNEFTQYSVEIAGANNYSNKTYYVYVRNAKVPFKEDTYDIIYY